MQRAEHDVRRKLKTVFAPRTKIDGVRPHSTDDRFGGETLSLLHVRFGKPFGNQEFDHLADQFPAGVTEH